MTGPVRLASAKSIEEKAADWIERHAADEWSDEDAVALEAWLEHSPAHRVAYLRLKAAWARADRLVVLRPQATDAPLTRNRLRPVALRIAAGVVLLVAGTTAIREVTHVSDYTYATRLGEHKRVVLSDG